MHIYLNILHILIIYFDFSRCQPNSPSTNHFALERTTVGCGGTYTDSSGIVQVDNTTGDPTVSQHECKWTIIAPPGKQVELTVRYLGFQQQSPFISMSCSYDMSVMPFRFDTFHVFNGRNNQSGHSYQSICFAVPDSHPLKITSTSNEMFIFMQYALQRMVLQGNMLLLFEYKFKDGGCGTTLTASIGYLTSPNFPAAYPTGAECIWLIKVQNGYTIRLTLTTFHLGQLMMSGCTDPPPPYDGYLAIYDGDSDQSPGLGRFCGNNIPELPTVTSSSNVMFVRFQGSSLDITPPMGSSGQLAPIGFSANYSILGY